MEKNKTTNLNEVKTAGTAPLGIYAKSSTTYNDNVNASNPIGTRLREVFHSYRIKRYSLLKTARKYLINYAREVKAKTNELHKISRTINCKHAFAYEADCVKVDFNSKNAYYTGLQTCGSVWNCPVCSARITEVRRKEIAKATEEAYKQGYQAVMITFTFPHNNKMPLKETLRKQAEALKIFREGNAWTCFKTKNKFLGLIRALEVTHGHNGWHPHTHELWFIDPEVKDKAFKSFILKRWIECLKKANLLPENPSKAELEAVKKRSVDVKMNCKASDYLAKNDSAKNWGIDRELSKSANKGRAKGLHAFEFLAEDIPKNQKLYIEFVNAMKGKSQLFWSPGLKKLLKIDEISDADIAGNEDEEEKLHENQVYFTQEFWDLILEKDYRSQVLNRLENAENVSEEFWKIIKFLNVVQDDPQ